MTIRIACSWCDSFNTLAAGPTACGMCGHRADRPRLLCDCPACRPGLEARRDEWLMLANEVEREAVRLAVADPVGSADRLRMAEAYRRRAKTAAEGLATP